MPLSAHVRHETWPIAGDFRISRGAKTAAEVVTVRLVDGEHEGRGECVPYARYGERPDGVMAAIEAAVPALPASERRAALQSLLPPGAARNAIDCALWDLAAKRAGQRAWQIAGLRSPAPVATAYTLSLGTPAAMKAAASDNAHCPVLKLKLGGDAQDLDRVRGVRDGAPGAVLIVDANEAWDAATFEALAPAFAELGVALIEQPLPAGEDAALEELQRPVPVCADESCHDRASLPTLAGRYDVVNIKLDKTGGLTEALALAREARQLGLGLMVGCMVSTSLAMAPALMLTRGASFVDLDGPLLLQADRPAGLVYDQLRIEAPDARLWG